jgi:thiamine-monophosphate kinase
LGLAAAGLEVLQSGKGKLAWTRPLVSAFSRPRPRLAAGGVLGHHHLASSLMDCSDGLEASVKLLCESSGVGAEIRLADLPIPPALERWVASRKRHPWDYALSGGEDYELIFTVRPSLWNEAKRRLAGVTRIGQILSRGRGVWAVTPQGRHPLKGYGFAHFNAA